MTNTDTDRMVARVLQDPGLQQEWLRQDNLIYGGLIAGCVALVQPFLSTAPLDTAGVVAVVSFSGAIPLLAALLMVNQHEAFRHRRAESQILTTAKVVAQGLAVLGIAAAFWHIMWPAGVAILVSALVGSMVHAASFTRLEGLDRPPPSEG